MTRHDALEKILASYTVYYNIERSSDIEGISAEAVFDYHDEQYFLIRRAKLSEADTKEYVYFAAPYALTLKTLLDLTAAVWNKGQSKVVPGPNHRNTDITLVIITEQTDSEVMENVRKIHYSKSFRFGLHGWSNFRLVVYDLSTGEAAHNRLGSDLRKTINNIFK